MLVIKLELHDANTGKVSELGRLEIVNDGTGTREVGNYNYMLLGKDARGQRMSWIGSVLGWSRRNSAWQLVQRVLSAAHRD